MDAIVNDPNLTTDQKIELLFPYWLSAEETFAAKGHAIAARRTRKALSEIAKLAKTRRAEIQEVVNAAKGA